MVIHCLQAIETIVNLGVASEQAHRLPSSLFDKSSGVSLEVGATRLGEGDITAATDRQTTGRPWMCVNIVGNVQGNVSAQLNKFNFYISSF